MQPCAMAQGADAAPTPAFCSLRWRVYWGDLPSHTPSTWSAQAAAQRRAYRHLCATFRKRLEAPVPNEPLDPLQSGAKNLWQEQHAARQNQEQIELDVQRLEMDDAPRRALAQLLYVWACVHADLGYRQGMHELAAFLWKVRADDAQRAQRDARSAGTYPPAVAEARAGNQLPTSLSQDDVQLLLAPDEVEADTFFLVSSLLHRLRPYFGAERTGTPALLKALLHRVDPALAQHLATLQLDWQPILLRWHRLLYLHEFSADEILRLWDALLYADPALELVQYVSVAMVLRQRDVLLSADYGVAMQALMHYAETHTSSARLVDQAEAMHAAPTPATGASIASENRTEPLPEASVAAKARDRLYELTESGAARLAHLAAFQRREASAPAWSPRAEDRLRSEQRDKDTQRRRAMLSLDDDKAP